MRLIDADALIERVDKEREYLKARGQLGAEHILVHNFRDLIDNAPTVDPFAKVHFERPHGEWIKLRDYDFKCSYCGCSLMDKYGFCPDCGADMRGDKNAVD